MIDTDQYEQLCEYSKKNGQTVKELIHQAITNYAASSEKQAPGGKGGA